MSRKCRHFAPASRYGRSYVPVIVAFTLLAVFLSVLFFRPSERSSRTANRKQDAAQDAQVTSPPVVPEGWVSVGGVYRPASDVVAKQPLSSKDPSTAPKMIQGFSPAIDPNANEQTKLVAASLKTKENPERFSSFIVPKSFDANAFKADP